MNRVLLKLYWMSMKAAFRSLGRKFTTVRGAILSTVTFGFLAAALANCLFMIVMRSQIPFAISERTNLVANLLPLGMLAYFLAAITPALGERAIQFSPSEIDFLFPAPFTRRQLLAFFLLRGLIGKLALSIIVMASMAMLFPSLLSASVGIFLSLVFLHGVTIVAQLLQQTIGTQLHTRARRIILVIVIVAAGIGIARAMPNGVYTWKFLSELRSSTPIQVIAAPFAVFSNVMVAPQLIPGGLMHLAIALAMIAVVYGLVFGLDSRYEDLAVQSSQRRYERLQAARRGNMYSAASNRTEYTRSLIPPFPWWQGIGPNLRRKLVSGVRDLQNMLWLALVIAVVMAGVIIYVLRENPNVVHRVGYMVLGATLYVTFIMSSQMPFGFRGDLNHMEVLKALPIRPFAIASAEVIGATIIGCLGQWFLIAVAILGAPSQTLLLLSGAAFFVPFNLLLFGTNDLLLLLFPFRLSGGSGPDVTLVGRVMIIMLGSFFAVAVCFGIAAIPAAAVFLLTSSWTATWVAGWIGSMILGSGLLLAVASAFRRFDISTDMPD
jgi:ABC-2 type transport system permease protein